MLDRQLDIILKLARGKGLKKIHDLAIEEARSFANEFVMTMQLLPVDLPKVIDSHIQRKDGSFLNVRTYYANLLNDQPILIFFHGGGFALYDIETHDSLCRYFCEELNVNIISVNYRRSPEYPYPSALEDAMLAVTWILENAHVFNGDKNKVMLSGDSVGGYLACLVYQKLNVSYKIHGLFLLYPVFNFENAYDSFSKYGENYFLDTDTMIWFEKMYNTKKIELDLVDPAFFAQSNLLIYIAIAEYDVLHDQAVEFIETVRKSNSTIQYDIFQSLPHNFGLMAGKIKNAKKALDQICQSIKQFNINNITLLKPEKKMEEQLKYYQEKLNYEMDPSDLFDSLTENEKIVVVDTRKSFAFEKEHIPSAINLPHREMNEECFKKLDRSFLYVCYCDGIGCNASTKGALKMTKAGFKVKELIGGIEWWIKDGYETKGSTSTKGLEIQCSC